MSSTVVFLKPRHKDLREFEMWAKRALPSAATPNAFKMDDRCVVYLNSEISAAWLGWVGATQRRNT